MNLIPTELSARLAQLTRGLDQVRSGIAAQLQEVDSNDFNVIIRAFNQMANAVASRESEARERDLRLALAVSRGEKLLDAALDGIAFVGVDGTFHYANRQFCEQLGIAPHFIVAKAVDEVEVLWNHKLVAPAKLRHIITPHKPGTNEPNNNVVDEIVEFSGPDVKYAQAYGAPVYDDDGCYAGRLISLHDNTREMELDKLKTDFISVVSHELRTPLTSIKGYTDLMLSGQTGDINDIQREFLGILQSSANRLNALINDILDLSKIDAGKMEVGHNPVNYLVLLDNLVKLMTPSADEKHIRIQVDAPLSLVVVAGDDEKIVQVLSNLVSNAIKYTPNGGNVQIVVEATSSNFVKTRVVDSGIGISASDQKMLFQKFFRADNSLTRQAGGTGLGLVIVKSIVELLGGSIWVQSETGMGSEFTFTLPLYQKTASNEPDGTSVSDRGIALVLVVGNPSSSREALQHALHRRGYGVVSASSSSDACRAIQQHRPNVVMVDMESSNWDGLSIIRAIRSDPTLVLIPICVFSVQKDGTEEASAMGSFTFLDMCKESSELADSVVSCVTCDEHVVHFVFVLSKSGQFDNLNNILLDRGHRTTFASSAEESIQTIATAAPGALLFNADNDSALELPALLRTIKSERELAKIPIVFLTKQFDVEGVGFTQISESERGTSAVDSLCNFASILLRGDL